MRAAAGVVTDRERAGAGSCGRRLELDAHRTATVHRQRTAAGSQATPGEVAGDSLSPEADGGSTGIGKGYKFRRADRSHCLTAKAQRCGGQINRGCRGAKLPSENGEKQGTQGQKYTFKSQLHTSMCFSVATWDGESLSWVRRRAWGLVGFEECELQGNLERD